MRKPTLSVITLVYNQAPFLQERIRSICTQTFKDFEWIVLDDFSTDHSAEVLQRELRNVPQLKKLILHDQNIGVYQSYEEALSWCEADFVARAEGDDTCAPDYFEKAIDFLVKYPNVSFVHTAYRIIDSEGVVKRVVYPYKSTGIIPGTEVFRDLVLRGNLICSPSVIFRRNHYFSVGGINEGWTYAGDYELWLKLSAQYDVGYISEPLLDWRRLPQAISKRGTISPEGATEPYRVLNSVFGSLSSEQDHLRALRKKAIRAFSTKSMAAKAFWWLVYRREPRMALEMMRAANHYDPGVWLNPISYLATFRHLVPAAVRRMLKGSGGAMDFLPK
ncbi:glycosyltransferase [Litorilinea aerophila]|uniref:Glycosyltransferase n=1 Tax=Litorilinea aerophila TaxID=1204385 RepID=A0A540V9E6_9CHLR|nr:glycosyltransferase [Litorilinea aerophila]MCC9078810.1 glycosyltransferase [Litorilinea aerophila]